MAAKSTCPIFDEALRKRLAKAAAQGLSKRALAERFGCSDATIAKELARREAQSLA